MQRVDPVGDLGRSPGKMLILERIFGVALGHLGIGRYL